MEISEIALGIVNGISNVSKWITEQVTNIFSAMNVSVTPRFSGLLTFLVLAVLAFVSIKYIIKPALKISIAIALILLILGFFNWAW